MVATIIPPGHNPTPRAVIRTAPGMIALDATCITSAVRWYTLAELEAVNSRAAVAAACKQPETVECIYPMPAMYPREVFLGIANGILERAKREVEIRVAVADGQLPRVA